MGMDVFGNKPKSENGEYFRNNVWFWHPLAEYACKVAPEITSACRYWHTNDGDGLDDERSVALADTLMLRVASGHAANWELEFAAQQARLPREPCRRCGGTGTLPASMHLNGSYANAGGSGCDNCEGTGQVDPWEVNYQFTTDNVVKFVAFLRDCGGFEIW